MRKWLLPVAKAAMTATILALVVRQIDFRGALHALASIAPMAAIAAPVVVLAQTLSLATRLVRVAAIYGVRLRLADSYRMNLEAMFFSHAFVSFLGADALRAWRMRQLGLSLTDATAAVTLDRLIGLAVTHALVLLSLPWLLYVTSDQSPARFAYLVLATVGTIGFGVLLGLGALRGREGSLHRLRMRMPLHGLAVAAVEVATVGRHIINERTRLLPAWLSSILASIANMLVFAVILLGMGVPIQLAVGCALLTPAVLEIAMLPVSIAGLGLREGAAVVAFGALGLPADQALAASLAFGLAFLAIGLIGGVLWFFDRRRAGVGAAESGVGAARGP